MPLAPLRKETARDTIPFTFGGLFQITREMPLNWTRVVRPELGLPIAWSKELFVGEGVEPMPVFLRLDVAGDELIPVWTLGSVSQNASEQIPLAKHAEIKQVQDLGLTWSGYVDNSEALPLEIKAALAQLAEIPYDFAVKAVAGEEVPAAILAKLQAVASLPIGKWPEGAILFVEGVDCVWVIKALPPGSETWPIAGCDDGESS
jgi:hypothetical protein